MSQEQSNSCKTSIDQSFTKSLSKVSISQVAEVQADPKVLFPSLAQIVFGQRHHVVNQAILENDDTKLLKNQNPDVLDHNQYKRSALGELQRQMALQIDDDGTIIDEKYCDTRDLQKISALPFRTLILAQKLIKHYASQQLTAIDSLEAGRKIRLFASLLLSALQLKTLSIEQLQGQAELSLFSFDEKEIIKYISSLTESVSWAINMNLKSKQSIWLQLEQKIKDPENKQLRRKFLRLSKFTKNQNSSSCQQKLIILCNSQEKECVQNRSECCLGDKTFIRHNSVEGEVENETYPTDNCTINTSLVVEQSLNNSERNIGFREINGQNTEAFGGMGGERLNKDIQDNLPKQIQTLDFSEPLSLTTENNINYFSKNAVSQICESTQKEVSNATEGYLTEIELSFDGAYYRKEDNSELFKSSGINGYTSEESINISSII